MRLVLAAVAGALLGFSQAAQAGTSKIGLPGPSFSAAAGASWGRAEAGLKALVAEKCPDNHAEVEAKAKPYFDTFGAVEKDYLLALAGVDAKAAKGGEFYDVETDEELSRLEKKAYAGKICAGSFGGVKSYLDLRTSALGDSLAKLGEFDARITELFARMTDLMVADSAQAGCREKVKELRKKADWDFSQLTCEGCRLENPGSVPNLHARFKKRLQEMLRGVADRQKRVRKAEASCSS